MNGAPTYEPDWDAWLLVNEVNFKAAVALTLNIDPDRVIVWRPRASLAERAEFDRRLSWLRKWPLKPTNFPAVAIEGHSPEVYLRDVVEFAKKARWELPARLLKLAEPENVDELASSSGATSVPKKAQDSAEVARPAKVSDRAWARFVKAWEIDPGFDLKRGAISKVARSVAREDGADFEAVRRDLNRVLTAQRDRSGQK